MIAPDAADFKACALHSYRAYASRARKQRSRSTE
jgi:hypothetical protein